jgi:hypothetical protein
MPTLTIEDTTEVERRALEQAIAIVTQRRQVAASRAVGVQLAAQPRSRATSPSSTRPTPSTFRQRCTALRLAPLQWQTARALSCLTARASSSSTSRPLPAPRVPARKQRGQGIGASDQPETTTAASR